MDKSGNLVAPTLLFDLPPDPHHGSGIKLVVIERVYRWSNPHRQLVYRLAHGRTEVIQLLPVQSSSNGLTDLGAVKAKVDVIPLVGHRILNKRESEAYRHRIGRNSFTLIIVRITLTEPKAA